MLSLRFVVCEECGQVFFLCSECDRGRCYCCDSCRELSRIQIERRARLAYARSKEGIRGNADRQQDFRDRRKAAAQIVTDRGRENFAIGATLPLPQADAFNPEVVPAGGEESDYDIGMDGNCAGAWCHQVDCASSAGYGDLKARLNPRPQHPRALATLLEAVALWEGMPVRAALCVDEREPGCASTFYREAFPGYEQTPLYDLAVVAREHRRQRNDGLGGMGGFQDLCRMVIREVAR